MNLRVLSCLLLVVGLLFVRPAAAQPVNPPAGDAKDGAQVDELLGHLGQRVTVIRDRERSLKDEKEPALNEIGKLYKRAQAVFPPNSPAVEMAGIIYAQSEARFNREVSGQSTAITMAQNQLTIVDKSVSNGDLKVPAGQLEQVGLKLKEFGKSLGDVSAIHKTLEGTAKALQDDVKSAVPPALVKAAQDSVVGVARLVVRPSLPSGTLEEGEEVMGFYLFINNGDQDTYGMLKVSITTGNGTVDNEPSLNGGKGRFVSVPGNSHVIEKFTFRRITGATGTITASSGFLEGKKD